MGNPQSYLASDIFKLDRWRPGPVEFRMIVPLVLGLAVRYVGDYSLLVQLARAGFRCSYILFRPSRPVDHSWKFVRLREFQMWNGADMRPSISGG